MCHAQNYSDSDADPQSRGYRRGIRWLVLSAGLNQRTWRSQRACDLSADHRTRGRTLAIRTDAAVLQQRLAVGIPVRVLNPLASCLRYSHSSHGGSILLIACANTNRWRARGARSVDLIRLSVGSRRRLIRQLLTEGVLLVAIRERCRIAVRRLGWRFAGASRTGSTGAAPFSAR